jgi:2-keto-3-deoxy-L-rhamnonate aldolase RhmA
MSDNFRNRLLRGERLIGTLLSLPSPELVEIASDAGFDWLFFDMEHGALEARDIQRLVQAAREPCAPLVRVPENREMWIKKALDTGAAGIIIPHVNSAEDAARAVHWSKYPPEGGRSVGFSRSNRYGTRFQESVESANAETVVIAQVEHIDGIRAIEAILDCSGVDAVFIGPYDPQVWASPAGSRTSMSAMPSGRPRQPAHAGGSPSGSLPWTSRAPSRPSMKVTALSARASTSDFSAKRRPRSSGDSSQETLDRYKVIY